LKTVSVALGERSYEIAIGSDILGELGEALGRIGAGPKEMIVSTRRLWQPYGAAAQDSLMKSGFHVSVALIDDDEESKSLATVTSIYDKLVENELDRSSGIVAVGGGVIGDLTGFAAATFMRGIRFIQVPTTLLAQVDSSVGGKTGVNHPRGKNLVGAFHQPTLVWADVSTLRTLPQRELRSGQAEVIKYGVIADAGLFQMLQNDTRPFSRWENENLIEIVSRCCSIKARIVQEDERESGIRSILNYGHTVGHALETLSGYRYYTHGEAVAVGMAASARISHALGIAGEETVRAQESMLIDAGLPTRIDRPLSSRDIMQQLNRDKKTLAGHTRWVLPKNIGDVFVTDRVPPEVVEQTLQDMITPERMTA